MKQTAGKVIIAVLMVVFYFLLWRPVRVATSQQIVKPVLEYVISASGSGVQIENSEGSVSFSIFWRGEDDRQSIAYRPPTGFFFLLSMVSMVFVTGKMRYYLYLTGLHAISFLLVLLFLVLGASSFHASFFIVELIITYLLPVLSMAYIPWLIYLRKKGKLVT